MAVFELKTFKDIYLAVMEELRVQTSDTATLNRIKRMINSTYLNEVVPAARWPWLFKRTDITHKAAYNNDGSDTADVTQGSTSVTLSSAIPASEGSKAGQYFKVSGYEEVYEIASHTSGSNSLTLTSEYTGSTNSTANFEIWTDYVSLPADASETIEVRHDFDPRPLIPAGPQRFIQQAQFAFTREDRPQYYSTDDYEASGSPETEANRNLTMRVWPAKYDKDTTLHILYKEEPSSLENDTDEPVMPIADRIVLVYGALRNAWILTRDNETAQANSQLYQNKLQEMQSRFTDSTDMPGMELDSLYTSSKRNSWNGIGSWRPN